MSYFNLVEEFLMEKEINNAAPATVKYYEGALKKFGDFLGEKKISQKEIDNYKHFLMKSVNPNSTNYYLRAIRTFVNFYEMPYTVKLVKETESVKEPYTTAELKLLLRRPPIRNFHRYKTWVMINTFISTGMRLSSALEIRVGDVNLESGVITLRHTKNRKILLVPISRQLEKVLNEYIKRRKGEPDDYLFCNSCGGRMDTRTAQQQVQRYNRARGINKTSIHLFRHTFATMYLKNGGDIYKLQKILGHSSIKITEKYLHYTTADIEKDFSKLNPLDNITYRVK